MLSPSPIHKAKPRRRKWWEEADFWANLNREAAAESRAIQKLIQQGTRDFKHIMHLAHMAYPGGAAWERTRERYFHRLADVHAKAQRGLREHKIKVADLLVRISKAEAAVKRGQMTLTAQEFGKYERMVRDGVRQQRREAAQQFTSGTPANESQG